MSDVHPRHNAMNKLTQPNPIRSNAYRARPQIKPTHHEKNFSALYVASLSAGTTPSNINWPELPEDLLGLYYLG